MSAILIIFRKSQDIYILIFCILIKNTIMNSYFIIFLKLIMQKKEEVIEGIESFKHPLSRKNKYGDILRVSEIIENVLLQVKSVLEKSDLYTKEVESLSRELYSRACIIDTVFNPLEPQDDSIDIWEFDITLNEDNISEWKEKNEIYYHTPSIWVFIDWLPVFLSHNYVEALWASDIETLRQDIIDWIALNKYYTEKSSLEAKEALKKLKAWEWYKNLVLETKTGKKISWNSFGYKNWIEIRIWNDITNGKFSKEETRENETNNDEDLNSLALWTRFYIKNYVHRVKDIIEIPKHFEDSLKIFILLWEVLEKVWTDWQYLMNMTVNENMDGENMYSEMMYNSNYKNALWLNVNELNEKIRNWTLMLEHYSSDTQELIKWLAKSLQNDWYYIDEFPIIDNNFKQTTYSWFRKVIEQKELWVKRSLWIWTDAISDHNAEIEKFLSQY